MARKKVKLAWIANDSARRATFKKRKKGLMKKVSELSTLCGVNACAIVYGPYEPQPEVWPTPSDAHRVLTKFKSLPEMEQSKKMMNQEGFLRQRISKLKEQHRRQQKENREFEVTQLMYQSLGGKCNVHDVGLEDISDLAYLVEEKMKIIQERVDSLKKNDGVPASTPNTANADANATATATTTTTTTATTTNPRLVGLGGGDYHHNQHQRMMMRSGSGNNTMMMNGHHHHHLLHHHPHHPHFGVGNGGNPYHVGGGTHHHHQEEQTTLDVGSGLEVLKRQPYFMEGMNPHHEHMTSAAAAGAGGGAGDELMYSLYGDGSAWSSALPNFLPY